jgi:hypothetical protein
MSAIEPNVGVKLDGMNAQPGEHDGLEHLKRTEEASKQRDENFKYYVGKEGSCISLGLGKKNVILS